MMLHFRKGTKSNKIVTNLISEEKLKKKTNKKQERNNKQTWNQFCGLLELYTKRNINLLEYP